MEKRVIFAFLLSFLVLMLWEYLFPTPRTVNSSDTKPRESVVSESISSEVQEGSKVDDSFAGDEKSQNSISEPQTLSLENKVLKIEFTNLQGGGISNIWLKDYFETPKHVEPYRLFQQLDISGPLLRVLQTSTLKCTRPALQQLSSSQITMTYFCGQPGRVSVTYRLGESYIIDIAFDFSSLRHADKREFWLSLPANLLTHETQSSSSSINELMYDVSGNVERVVLKPERSEPISTEQAVEWVAFGDRYFFMGVKPPGFFKPRIQSHFKQKGQMISHGVILKHLISQEAARSPVHLKAFLGPKDPPLLTSMGTMSEVVDFGFFGFIASPIYSFLKLTYAYVVSNYGLAIILLTILVRLLFLPLTLKGMGNMQSMQKLQPELQKLKEKYKDNREKLNQEMVALFRAHKVNPLGGCLPILIQIPVFFALYTVLMNAVDLYHAPFFGWITDLSGKDPFYVLPVLLGAAFFAQQKLTPSTVDATTQKVMMIMPIVFTFFMLNLPSGLNLYILTSTVLGVIQQLVMNYQAGRQSVLT